MNIRHRTPLRLVEPISAEVRVVGTVYGSLLGPEYKTMVGDRCFWVGAPTLKMLKSGYSPDELALIDIDPEAPGLED